MLGRDNNRQVDKRILSPFMVGLSSLLQLRAYFPISNAFHYVLPTLFLTLVYNTTRIGHLNAYITHLGPRLFYWGYVSVVISLRD